MHAFINNLEADPRAFVVEGVVLSSARPVGVEAIFYIELSTADFMSILSKSYIQLIHDLKIDEENCGDVDFLSEAGYPSLSELIKNPKLLLQTFDAYLAIDFFGIMLDSVHKTKRQFFFITSFSSAITTGDIIRLEGLCIPYTPVIARCTPDTII